MLTKIAYYANNQFMAEPRTTAVRIATKPCAICYTSHHLGTSLSPQQHNDTHSSNDQHHKSKYTLEHRRCLTNSTNKQTPKFIHDPLKPNVSTRLGDIRLNKLVNSHVPTLEHTYLEAGTPDKTRLIG